jgi:hypothetical protein
MATNMSNKLLIPLSLFIPSGIVWFLIQIQFWRGALIANPVVILLGLAAGAYLGSQIRFSNKKYKFIFLLFYALYIVVSVLFVALIVSCLNGDCI